MELPKYENMPLAVAIKDRPQGVCGMLGIRMTARLRTSIPPQRLRGKRNGVCRIREKFLKFADRTLKII